MIKNAITAQSKIDMIVIVISTLFSVRAEDSTTGVRLWFLFSSRLINSLIVSSHVWNIGRMSLSLVNAIWVLFDLTSLMILCVIGRTLALMPSMRERISFLAHLSLRAWIQILASYDLAPVCSLIQGLGFGWWENLNLSSSYSHEARHLVSQSIDHARLRENLWLRAILQNLYHWFTRGESW